MKHKYSSIMASSLTKVVSVAAIATMTVNIIIPDHKQSETENRPLQTFPSWNTEHVLSGQYTKDLRPQVHTSGLFYFFCCSSYSFLYSKAASLNENVRSL